jgi:hypothetical protein
MKLNAVLPWLCVLGVTAGLAAVYVKGMAKDSELARLREDNQQAQQAQAELEEARNQAKFQQDEIAGLRKDKEELLRLRNEIGKLRQEQQQLSKQVQLAQSESQRAQAQAAEVRAGVQQMQNENQQLRTAATQGQQLTTCVSNLQRLTAAKQQWALEHNKTPDAIPTLQDIFGYLGNTAPLCPAGGAYAVNALNQKPTCSVQGHAE